MAIENVTRPTSDDGGLVRSTLLCGKPDCDRIAETIVEFEWATWSGVLGACWEHHEDLCVLLLKGRFAADELGPDVPRD